MGVWEQVEGKGHSKEMRAGEAARLKAEQCGAVRCSAVQCGAVLCSAFLPIQQPVRVTFLHGLVCDENQPHPKRNVDGYHPNISARPRGLGGWKWKDGRVEVVGWKLRSKLRSKFRRWLALTVG